MPLGWWFRRTAAATVLTLGLGLAAGNGAALGVELPAVDPALGSETTVAGVKLPSTSVLPLDPQIGPTVPVAPIAPTQPVGPTGPSPSGSSGSPSASTSSQASGAHRGKVSSTGRNLRNVVNGDRSPGPSPPRVRAALVRRSAATSGRRGKPDRRRTSHSSPAFQLYHPSQLDQLGRILGQDASPPRFLGGFSASATGGADWAPPLLTIMFLIGLGGFLRVVLPASRRNS